MKKLLLALLALVGAVATTQAAEVIDVRIKEATLTGDKIVKESHRALGVDGVLVMYVKGEVLIGEYDYNEGETGAEKETEKYIKGLVSGDATFLIAEDGTAFEVEQSVLLGKFKISDDKAYVSLKGVGVGTAGPDDAIAQFSLSARYNQRLSAMDDDDLVAYIAKKLKLDDDEKDALEEALGFDG